MVFERTGREFQTMRQHSLVAMEPFRKPWHGQLLATGVGEEIGRFCMLLIFFLFLSSLVLLEFEYELIDRVG